MSFKNLNLNKKLLDAVAASGFTEPTEIQREAIPAVSAGRDVMASAQTGTGKTAAFVLPALQRLLEPAKRRGNGPRVLVLTPTRELAMQVNDNIRQLGRFCKVTNGSVVGGVPYPPQIKLLRQPLDLLVATPGRLMDHMGSGRVDFSRLEFLVLDEADRMLDMGFVDAVKEIAAATPASRQTLLFSATLEGKVLSIAKQLLKDPLQIQLAANHQQHALITQTMHKVDNTDHKHDVLSHYLDQSDLYQAVIFTATKRGADKLARTMSQQGHATAALHGDMRQGQRKRTVDQMRRGKLRVLVATDVAARGLDIKGISHVINFDLPMVAEDYIHRIGRTGRGGTTGNAVSLVSTEDWGKLIGIERLTGKKLSRETIPGLEPAKPEPRGNKHGNNGKRTKPKSKGDFKYRAKNTRRKNNRRSASI
jgi:superfamily II DNA/RNA helicase